MESDTCTNEFLTVACVCELAGMEWSDWHIYLFYDFQVKEMLRILKEAGSKYKVGINEPKLPLPLPPASFQRFLKSNDKIPGIVLTDHEKEYSNK